VSEYKDVIETLFNINRVGGMKQGMDNITELDVLCGRPRLKYKSVHIAGTNGKGSVATKIAKTLEYSGYRVGLFTSPHISSFRERIRVNGDMISKEAVIAGVKKILHVADENYIPATYFEVTTMLALWYFAEQKVDFAIIETGLGGRFDATNILNPLLTVITSISLDHTHILGSKLEEIAREKAGIIKKSIPVVVGPKAYPDIMKEIAMWRRSVFVEVKCRTLHVDEENTAIATTALKLINRRFPIKEEALNKGVNTKLPCRLEIFSREDLEIENKPESVVFDAAHNPEGFQRLFASLADLFPEKKLRVVIGLSQLKDYKGCFAKVVKNTHKIHLVKARGDRGENLHILKDHLEKRGVTAESAIQSIPRTLDKALSLANENDEILVICGSFFIMGEAKKHLQLHVEEADILDLNDKINFASAAKVN